MTSGKYKNANSFRASLEERLKTNARSKGIDIQRLRRQVAFDRFLARLLFGKASRWYLKGGYAMELRIKGARTTRDVDMGRILDSGTKVKSPGLLEEIQDLVSKDLGDFFEYRVGAPILDLNAPYGGERFPVEARMDGRTFVKFHLDVGLGDSLTDALEDLKAQDWLGFAGIAAPVFQTISKEQQFAEKLHAYTKPWKDRENTRARDLVDMVLLMEQPGVVKARVRTALKKTFGTRKSHPLPLRLEAPPVSWGRPFAEMASDCGMKHTLQEAFEMLVEYYGDL
jgi:hypothetical protein